MLPKTYLLNLKPTTLTRNVDACIIANSTHSEYLYKRHKLCPQTLSYLFSRQLHNPFTNRCTPVHPLFILSSMFFRFDALVVEFSRPLPHPSTLYEPLSKLLISPLMSPIMLPRIITYITPPLGSLDYSSYKTNTPFKRTSPNPCNPRSFSKLHLSSCLRLDHAGRENARLEIPQIPSRDLGGCQNYGPFLGPYYTTAPNI